MPTPYAKRLASLAEKEFDDFSGFHETSTKMAKRIRKYWEYLGFSFKNVGVPWSAVFVCFHVKSAGASNSQFSFSARHGVFVRWAIANGQQETGFFRGRRIQSYAPKIGDIIQNNRNGHTFDFAYAAANDQYESHTAIVVEEGVDGSGRYVRTIGGNESDTVGERVVRVSAQGRILQPSADPSRYICVIETLM